MAIKFKNTPKVINNDSTGRIVCTDEGEGYGMYFFDRGFVATRGDILKRTDARWVREMHYLPKAHTNEDRLAAHWLGFASTYMDQR